MKVEHLCITLVVAMLSLSGCAVSPPMPAFETKKGDRIGFVVEIGEGALHTHIGTTIFNNFDKKYPVEWQLDSSVTEILRNELAASGFEPIDLETKGMSSEEIGSLVIRSGDKWKFAPGKEDIVSNLVEDKRLKAVVIVKEGRVLTALECSGGPCAERYADSSGLYSRSFFGLSRYYAVPAFNLDVYLLEPPANIALGESLRAMMRIPAVSIKDYPEPADFENITKEEWIPVRNNIISFTKKMASQIASDLRPSRLLK